MRQNPRQPAMQCRPGCAACCTAPSISTPIPGMPQGKPAGVPCIQLTPEGHCALFNRPERPAVCRSLQAEPQMCGPDRHYAMRWLKQLEQATQPSHSSHETT